MTRPTLTRPLRVAHLTTVDSSLRFLLHPQLTAIRDAGGDAIGISAPGPWVEGLEAEGIRHLALPSSTRGMDVRADLRTAYELWRLLRREGIDVLHTHNPKPGIYGRVLGRLARVPVVVNTIHGLYATEDDSRLKRFFVYTVETLASRFSDAELVQNAEDLDLMTRLRVFQQRKLRLLGNGVDLARFDPGRVTPTSRAETRADVGANENDIVIGMVGRLVAEKGYPELLAAMSQLDDRYLLVCVGPEDPEKSDGLRIDDLSRGEGARVRFLGQRLDMPELYAAMDVFVLPSHREGFPRAAMEAAAMGLPVIATDIRGCRQVVEDGVNGLLVPVASPADLAEAIARISQDEELRLAMGRRSAERARLEFDERRVVATVIETYNEVIQTKTTSDGRRSRHGIE